MTSITAASKAIDRAFAYVCVCVCWSLLHSSGVGRRRALQEIRDKRDATSLSFFPVQALPLQVPESPGLLRPGLKVRSLSGISGRGELERGRVGDRL